MRTTTILALCVLMGLAAPVCAQNAAAPVRYIADTGAPVTPPAVNASPQQAFPAVRSVSPDALDHALSKPARQGGGDKNGDAAKGNGDKNGAKGEDEGKTVCKEKYGFNIPLGRTPKCGEVKGEVEKEVKVKCPPPPDKPALCPGDYPNGNGDKKEEEKEEKDPEVDVSGRAWDSVQGG
jgi:hypothetical protein